MERKLAYAKDVYGKVKSIENTEKKDQLLFCPVCNKEVIPKQGDDNIWHFAHREGGCESSDGLKDANLTSFFTKTTDEVVFEKNPEFFTCKKCRDTMRKSLGIKWKEGEYLCKNCFHML